MTSFLNATVIGLLALPAALVAQAGPPRAPQPGDASPALIQPKSPSPPPSAVAPRAAAVRQRSVVAPDSGPLSMRRAGLPPDSVRPAPTPLSVVAPMKLTVPPPEPLRAGARVQRATSAEAAASDEPPAGATARCKNGTFVTASVDESTCADHGGIAVLMPQRPALRRPNP